MYGPAVVRSKPLVLGFEGGFVGSTYGANATQHGIHVDLKITQPLSQAFGRRIDFHQAFHNFFWVLPNDEGVHNHGSNTFGVSNNLHFTEFEAILRDPCS